MQINTKSLFNLIEIFRGTKSMQVNALTAQTHREQRQHHDYYCDAEKPYVNQN